MDKIKQLMVESGLSEEAAAKICESLDSHATNVRADLQEEYDKKLAKAKKLCVEETEKYKRELARRTQIYLESKSDVITSSILKNAQERGTEAQAKLEKIAGITEGIELDGKANSELQASNGKLRRQLKESKDVNRKLKSVTVQLKEIAANALRRNKILESRANTNNNVVSESKTQTKPSGRTHQVTKAVLKENVLKQGKTVSGNDQQQNHYQKFGPNQIADLVEG